MYCGENTLRYLRFAHSPALQNMTRRLPTYLSLLLLIASAARAEDRTSMPTLNQATRGGWLQFSLVAGRIALDGSRMGDIQMGPNQIGLTSREQLNIRTSNGEPSLTYEWSNAKEQVNIDITGSRVHLRRGPKSESGKEAAAAPKPAAAPEPAPPQTPSAAGGVKPGAAGDAAAGVLVDYEQKPQEKAVLTLVVEGKPQTFAGGSLWHLFILYPEESRKYSGPAGATVAAELETRRHGDIARNGTAPAFRQRRDGRPRELGEVGRAARRRALRGAAVRRPCACAANPSLLVYLQQLDYAQLDAEQQFRIRRIADTLSADQRRHAGAGRRVAGRRPFDMAGIAEPARRLGAGHRRQAA